MRSALRVAFLLVLVAGALTAQDLKHEAAAERPKRWSGLFPSFRSKGGAPPPPTTAGGGGSGFDLADAVNPAPKAPPAGGNGGGFHLEDALRPAQNPTAGPSGSCQGDVEAKLNAVMENQSQQLRLLRQMIPTSRFYERRTR